LLVFPRFGMLDLSMKAIALMTAVTIGLLCQPGGAVPAASIYEVKQGDSLVAIARRHKVTPAALVAANGIKDPSKLKIGQKLKIPAQANVAPSVPATPRPAPSAEASTGATREHVVAQGDTLYGIARAAGVSVAQLTAANPGVAPTALQTGQKLRVPVAGAEPAIAEVAPPVPSQPATITAPETVAPAGVASLPTQDTPTQTTPTQDAARPQSPIIATAAVTVIAPVPPAPVTTQETTDPVAIAAPPVDLEVVEKEPIPPVSGIELIKLTSKMTFAEFASAHHTTTERLNTLNGWNLTPNSMLAAESEFWVPKP
jgi:LysM repeat protein